MCGVAGFHGLKIGRFQRSDLISELGVGIDKRGGDSIGYVGVLPNGTVTSERRSGRWDERKALSFIDRASLSETVLLHARYATCGKDRRDPRDAHPFEIKRDGKVVLWGMHNGIIYNAHESAKRHGRPYTVDSRELFELLADGLYNEIEMLDGYGTIVWVSADDPSRVRMAKISEDGALEVAKARDGGIIWGSTEHIVKTAVRYSHARAEIEGWYQIDPFKIHIVHEGELRVSEETVRVNGMRVAKPQVVRTTRYPEFNWEKWFREQQAFHRVTEPETSVYSGSLFDDLEALDETEEEDLKRELCARYDMDEEELEGMSYAEAKEYIEDLLAF